MVDYKSHMEVIEKLYEHTCTVIENRQEKDPIKKVLRPVEVEIYKDIPCRLSFNSQMTEKRELTANAENKAKLFLSINYRIKEGSRILVNIFGRQFEYKLSTAPFFYGSHQEVELVFEKEVL